ncbi:hypothetical protein K474DRAFT_1774611 [Panus rudis PR-1116 ss-1]|nr:hypothetical protein K474DRAFT_1774611 [Panus rudis PR-1116 ss-1]
MGQYWELYNISARQAMSSSAGVKLSGGMLFSEDWHALVRYLAKPTGYIKEVTWRKLKVAKPEHKKQLGALFRLPDEILALILKEMLNAPRGSDEFWSFFTLAITNSYLSDIAYEVVQRHFAENWAAHRLICVGDYASTNDLPPGVFHQDELDAIASLNPRPSLQRYLKTECIYDHRATSILGFEVYKAPEALNYLLLRFHAREDPAARRQVKCLDDLCTPRLLYDAPYHEWVLADIVTKELVRLEAIVDLQECEAVVGTGPFIYGSYQFFGLGHVILSRICWSADPSVAMETDGLSYEIHRGPWAGHRFTITTKDRLGKGDEWTDISDQVRDDMEVLAKHCFETDDWREYVKGERYDDVWDRGSVLPSRWLFDH